jgi:hypothetical protein
MPNVGTVLARFYVTVGLLSKCGRSASITFSMQDGTRAVNLVCHLTHTKLPPNFPGQFSFNFQMLLTGKVKTGL